MGYIKSSDLACEHSIWERQSLFIALLGLFPFEFYFKCYCSSHVLFAGKISKCLTAGGAPPHSEPARPLKKYLKTIIVPFAGLICFLLSVSPSVTGLGTEAGTGVIPGSL